ncbi:MAG: PIG-L family deacetylase [Ardenticatenaceae bacterium]|nr:PIG-L family deacetylase [Ardenticatenaceae bacterium]
MKKMMAVFAHPDDEGAVAGTLYRYAQNNTEVVLVCATRGEVGQISDPSLATPETLGEVRQQELEAACRILGIKHLEFLDYRDSGMVGTPENVDARALVQADEDEVVSKIGKLYEKYAPDIVITFEPFGWYGHPDHQVVSRWATAAFMNAEDQKNRAAQNRRLFHAVIPISKFEEMIQEAVKGGFIEEMGSEGFGGESSREVQAQAEAQVTHEIYIEPLFDIRQEAMAQHRTQFSEEHMFRKIPKEIMLKAAAAEHFIQVYPTPSERPRNNHRLNDLFDLL